MHRSAATNAAILHHQDDDVDLFDHCNVFVYLFSASGFPTVTNTYLKGHLSVIALKTSHNHKKGYLQHIYLKENITV